MKYLKGEFVVLPNKQKIKGQKSPIQSVYIWICDHADENGICFPKRMTLAREAGVGIKVLDRAIFSLIELGILQKRNRRKEGSLELTSNEYQIIVVDDEEVASKTTLPSVNSDPTGSVKKDSETLPHINSTPLKKGKAIAFSPYGKKDSMEAIILSQEQQKMMDDEKRGKRAHAIIGAFVSYKMETLKHNIRTKGQLYEFWQRHIKTANRLKTWDDDQLERAFQKADKEYQKIEWSLEALLKYLTK